MDIVVGRRACRSPARHRGSRTIELALASGYHDHNWGRWHWGDDVGWEWGAFLAPSSGSTFDQSHHESRLPVARSADAAGAARRDETAPWRRKRCRIARRSLRWSAASRSWCHGGPPPGSGAPYLPKRVRVRAGDGIRRRRSRLHASRGGATHRRDPRRPGYPSFTRWSDCFPPCWWWPASSRCQRALEGPSTLTKSCVSQLR